MQTSPALSQPQVELAGGEARFRDLCEHLPLGMFVIDLRSNCTYANRAARAMLGVADGEAIEQGWARYVHAEDSAMVLDRWQAAFAGETDFIVEYRCQLPHHDVAWLRTHAVPQRDAAGLIVGYVGSLRDITEERRAAQSLFEQERVFRTIFEQAGVGVAVVDSRTGQFVRINQKYCDLVGYTPDEMCKRTFQSLTHPDDLTNNAATLRDMIAGKLHKFSMDKRYIHKDGRVVWVHLTITPLWNPGEPPDHHITIVEDITERKAAEAELRRQEAMLAHVTRLSTMGEMVAGIAHEVNQPLYSIVNFAKATSNVLADGAVPDFDELRSWNDEIAAAAARAGEIVRRLRDYTRPNPESNQREDLSAIVRDSLELVQYEVRRVQVHVELALADDLPAVQVDRVQIQQVLVNLMKNAIEALTSQPAAERRLHIATRRAGQRVCVDVADNGPGFAQLGKADPFEPFVTNKSGGMGLGLPISRTIIEAHGGQIAARKNHWGGATFTFCIPEARASA